MRELPLQQQLIAELDATARRVDVAIAGLNDEQASRPAADTFLFTGQQHDAKARGNSGGLYYLRARYYDPILGRFLTPDPLHGSILSGQSQNRYVYALNNPVNRTDPSGLSPESVGPCSLNELIAVAIIHLATLLGIVLPGVFLLTNPATASPGVILLEYLALPIESGNTVLTRHACHVI